MNYLQKKKEKKRAKQFAELCQSIGYWTITFAGCVVIVVIIIIILNIIL